MWLLLRQEECESDLEEYESDWADCVSQTGRIVEVSPHVRQMWPSVTLGGMQVEQRRFKQRHLANWKFTPIQTFVCTDIFPLFF
jgi:hypothetical protein